jgi:cellulose biosynthesis protein BcsQ
MLGEIVTFYSYKGGVGRTMALANVAVLLANWGYRVLMVDWDLEAPGLEYYFTSYGGVDKEHIVQQEGIVDLLRHSRLAEWQEAVVEIPSLSFEKPGRRSGTSTFQHPLHLLTAGQRTNKTAYFAALRQIDFRAFYMEEGGDELVETMRMEWMERYDFILVDSRTGITDIGGICTVQLPDMVVLFFTANEQSLEGILEVAQRANDVRQQLPFDRYNLLYIPVPSRVEVREEFETSQRWISRFAEAFADIYDDWISRSLDRHAFLERSKIPYMAYFSYGEKLPVLEHGTNDPESLGYWYENLAALIANNLEAVELFMKNRTAFIERIVKTDRLNGQYNYDVYISYSADDREWVEGWLIPRLEQAGLRVTDNRIFAPGRKIDEVSTILAERIKNVLIVITPAALASKQVQYELQTARRSSASTMLIPLMFKHVEPERMPQNLKHIIPADFTEPELHEEALERLLQTLQASPKAL